MLKCLSLRRAELLLITVLGLPLLVLQFAAIPRAAPIRMGILLGSPAQIWKYR
jgi:hypothetical protein